MRKRNAITYIIIGLIAIGIITSLIDNISSWIIPVLVFGTVFLLYKFPPKRYRKTNSHYSSAGSNTRHTQKQRERVVRKAKFRVIKGEKGNEDDTPRYH